MCTDPGLKLTADRILAEARNIHRDCWFGDRKVFLCALFDLTDPDVLETLDACRRAQLLVFVRADFVQGMDSDLVEASLWHIPGADFHFLCVAPR